MSKYYVRYIDINGKQNYPKTIKEFDVSEKATKYVGAIAQLAMDYLASHVYIYPEQIVSRQGRNPVSICLNGSVTRLYWVDTDFE